MSRIPARTFLRQAFVELVRRPGRAPAVLGLGWKAFFQQSSRVISATPVVLGSERELLSWRNGTRPAISIVVPVFNQIATTLACLRSLAGSIASAGSVELIVVDDASTDPESERLRALPGITYHRNRANQGFVGSCNAGAQLAKGRYVVFLNSDTVVTAGWIETLVARLDQPGVGLVGASLQYPDGRLQEAGGLVFADASGWNYGRNGHPEDPRYRTFRDSHYCSGAALALTRKRFEELGGFDVRYAPGYYEDTDLAMRVRASGARVVYEPESVVVHLEGASAGTDPASGMKAAQAVNRERFREKWEATLRQEHPPAGTDVDLAIRQEGRAWIVACTGVEPEESFLETVELLVGRGCVMDLFLGAQLPVERIQALRSRGVYAWPPDWHATGRWLLLRNGHAAHAALVDGSPVSQAWFKNVRRDLPAARPLWFGQSSRSAADRVTPVSGMDGILAALDA